MNSFYYTVAFLCVTVVALTAFLCIWSYRRAIRTEAEIQAAPEPKRRLRIGKPVYEVAHALKTRPDTWALWPYEGEGITAKQLVDEVTGFSMPHLRHSGYVRLARTLCSISLSRDEEEYLAVFVSDWLAYEARIREAVEGQREMEKRAEWSRKYGV